MTEPEQTGQTEQTPLLRDLSEAELRARRSIKWDAAPPGVLAAWVAETDLAVDPLVEQALLAAVADGVLGYPVDDPELARAVAGFAERVWGWRFDPALVLQTGDVMAGVRLVLETLCEPGPVVVPTPTYPPFLDVVPLTGRELLAVPLDPDAGLAELDLDAVEAALAAGARTVLLASPHNPWGRVFSRAELEGLRDVALRHGARVVADEIHAPLALDGAEFVPYLSLPGTAEHATSVLSASKAWNLPGLKCAQLVSGTATDAAALAGVPRVANHGVSPLGVVAAITAWTDGDPWLQAFRQRITSNRDLLADELARRLPGVRMRPLQGTYLAWLDARATGLADPAGRALARGRVLVNDGCDFGPGGEGHVRVNLATSPERVVEVVRRLAQAWDAGNT